MYKPFEPQALNPKALNPKPEAPASLKPDNKKSDKSLNRNLKSPRPSQGSSGHSRHGCAQPQTECQSVSWGFCCFGVTFFLRGILALSLVSCGKKA